MNNEKIFFPYGEYEGYRGSVVDIVPRVYDRLVDATAKYIYSNRVMYSLTGDFTYIRNVAETTTAGQKLTSRLASVLDNIYIYGAGVRGTRLYRTYPDIGWCGYIDKNKTGECNGLPVLKPNELKDIATVTIVISNMYHIDDIKRELIALGVNAENIICLMDYDREGAAGQYFAAECVGNGRKFAGGGLVDAGAFDLTDSFHFCDYCGQRDAMVYAFEPDKKNFTNCQQLLAQRPEYTGIKLINKALGAKQEMFSIKSDSENSSLGSHGSGDACAVVSADEELKGAAIGFIKMDVEGFELPALMGMQNIIKEQKPILALSIYHKRNDIFAIPKLLLALNPDYKFTLRHYSACMVDTVLYALPS